MPRRRWIEDGLVQEAPHMTEAYKPYVSEAWGCVTRARESFMAKDWEKLDFWSRLACTIGATAMCYSRGYEPAREFDVRLARDYCFDTFGTSGDEVFTRAEIVGEFLPVDYEIDESRHRLFEKSLASTSELVALIECHIAAEKRPPEPPGDPHVCYPRQGRRYY